MFHEIKAETFPTGMKEINFIFGKGVVVFNAMARVASGTSPLSYWLIMFCSPYSQISASLTIIDSITFVTIDAIDTAFGKFICFIGFKHCVVRLLQTTKNNSSKQLPIKHHQPDVTLSCPKRLRLLFYNYVFFATFYLQISIPVIT